VARGGGEHDEVEPPLPDAPLRSRVVAFASDAVRHEFVGVLPRIKVDPVRRRPDPPPPVTPQLAMAAMQEMTLAFQDGERVLRNIADYELALYRLRDTIRAELQAGAPVRAPGA
jgi:hypothetical protein